MTNWNELSIVEQLIIVAEVARAATLDELEFIGVHEDGTVEATDGTGYRYWYRNGTEIGTTAPWQLRA